MPKRGTKAIMLVRLGSKVKFHPKTAVNQTGLMNTVYIYTIVLT